MTETGRMISSTATENKPGLIKLFIKAIIWMEKNTERAHFCGKMIVAMRENLWKTTFMALVNISGKMAELMRVSGKTTRWTEKECSPGSMEGDMKDSIRTTKRKALEFSTSGMAEFTKDNGKMVDNMEKAYSERKTLWDRDYGKTDRESNGLKISRTKSRKSPLRNR